MCLDFQYVFDRKAWFSQFDLENQQYQGQADHRTSIHTKFIWEYKSLCQIEILTDSHDLRWNYFITVSTKEAYFSGIFLCTQCIQQ